ncbi:MAG TPA: hypothetical protein VFI76_02835, partial [Terrimicrobiaceae bacterium]|nr:hypothetical protein [Terrimicrobiaceae bacterium]
RLAGRMKQIVIIAGLLVIPCLISLVTGSDVDWAGHLGLALVFAFAALGHFARTDAMAQMIPPSVPQRRVLIQISGVFELAMAILVLAWPNSRLVGFVMIGFLIAVFPSNVYAAMRRVEFGGHSAGPRYLILRAPLQLLLILWVYWFVLE